ncbi:Rho termination factor N-terminal domain-containing protein [Clostridium porci]|uniref:Rho termination factor N-terminal domain-containing protein n=1 Tax=Clostridium porci TaxID=2605778 RepID=UPI003A909B94
MRLIKDNVERVADDTQADKLKALGFKAVGGEPAPADGNDNEKAIDEMTTAELKDLAKAKGIEGASSLTKAELLAVLKDVTMNG